MLAIDWERMCFNPTQCGIIPVKNTNHDSSEASVNYNMAYQYKDGGAPALYAIPVNGAKWIEGNFPFSTVLGSDLSTDGWYASALPWVTSDGSTNRIYSSMIWDVTGAICTGFYNCEDWTANCPNIYPSNYDCT